MTRARRNDTLPSMARSESRRKSSFSTEPDLFGPAAQPDLFGGAPRKREVYVPKQIHITNRLEDLLAQMRAARTWPWDWSVVRLHTQRTFDYLCERVTDPEEAQRWRELLAAETVRLMASTPPEPPPPLPPDYSDIALPEDHYISPSRSGVK